MVVLHFWPVPDKKGEQSPYWAFDVGAKSLTILQQFLLQPLSFSQREWMRLAFFSLNKSKHFDANFSLVSACLCRRAEFFACVYLQFLQFFYLDAIHFSSSLLPKIFCAIYAWLWSYLKLHYFKNETCFSPRNFSLSSELFSLGAADPHQMKSIEFYKTKRLSQEVYKLKNL